MEGEEALKYLQAAAVVCKATKRLIYNINDNANQQLIIRKLN
jgi:hypothetical protein